MTIRHAVVAIALAPVLLLSACGGGAHTVTTAGHSAIPDVRGMNAPDAVVRLLKAHYCVQLKLGRRVPLAKRFPVESQAPTAGSTRRAWSTVTLQIGVPTRAGAPRSRRSVVVGIDAWGGHAPCPPIRTTRG